MRDLIRESLETTERHSKRTLHRRMPHTPARKAGGDRDMVAGVVGAHRLSQNNDPNAYLRKLRRADADVDPADPAQEHRDSVRHLAPRRRPLLSNSMSAGSLRAPSGLRWACAREPPRDAEDRPEGRPSAEFQSPNKMGTQRGCATTSAAMPSIKSGRTANALAGLR